MTNGPLIIIGAARSGTKILRSVLAAHPALCAVPYDINYVWMAGHHRRLDDELVPEDLTPASSAFIRDYVESFRPRGGDASIVEKTVGNTLRVPFVRAVFPEARFVEIVRDGRDVAASARTQWIVRSSPGDMLTKLRTFPVRRAWRYGLDYAWNLIRHRLAAGKHPPIWGPRFEGIREAVLEMDLIEVCALQWARCVRKSREGLAEVPRDRMISLSYEEFVADPTVVMRRLLDFIELPQDDAVDRFCRGRIIGGNVGKWERTLTPEDTDKVLRICGEVLEETGYRI